MRLNDQAYSETSPSPSDLATDTGGNFDYDNDLAAQMAGRRAPEPRDAEDLDDNADDGQEDGEFDPDDDGEADAELDAPEPQRQADVRDTGRRNPERGNSRYEARVRQLNEQVKQERELRVELERAAAVGLTPTEYRAQKQEAAQNQFANVESYRAAQQANAEADRQLKEIDDLYQTVLSELNSQFSYAPPAVLVQQALMQRNLSVQQANNSRQFAIQGARILGHQQTQTRSAISTAVEEATALYGGKIDPDIKDTIEAMTPEYATKFVAGLKRQLGPVLANERARYAATQAERKRRPAPEGTGQGAPLPGMNPNAAPNKPNFDWSDVKNRSFTSLVVEDAKRQQAPRRSRR